MNFLLDFHVNNSACIFISILNTPGTPTYLLLYLPVHVPAY